MNDDLSLPPTLTAEDLRVIAILKRERKDWTFRCFEAALVHLSLAYRLNRHDPVMALFRLITAEEEAASGLPRALQARGYAGKGDLRPKDHVHKAAVYPFLRSVLKHASYLKMNGVDAVRLGISKDTKKPRLELALVLNGENAGMVARPTPPLNLRMREGHGLTTIDYRPYFLRLLNKTDPKAIRKYLDDKANDRNRLLYASPQGLRRIEELPDEVFIEHQNRVMAILKATLLIWPYKDLQPFVHEAVQCFLTVVNAIKKESEAE